MDKEEKRKKYHDALMKIFFPRKPPPQQQQQHIHQQVTAESVDIKHEDLFSDLGPDIDFEKGSSSDNESESMPQKLTRAQRKRIRRKKLKEAASQRRKIIGPLLPTHEDLEGKPTNIQEELVHRNVHETVQASDLFLESSEAVMHAHHKAN